MFLGEYEHSIDEKGRVAVPARFREELSEGMILTRGFDKCLNVYPRTAWEALRSGVGSLSVGLSDVRNLRRFVFSGAADVETDRQGRILIPPNLREFAGLAEQVVVVGNDTYFEIWSRERWQIVLETLDSDGSQLAQQLASLGL